MWLLTRPLPKLSKSCDQFLAAGIDVIGIAFHDIQPLDLEDHLLPHKLSMLHTDDIILVTSVYAATPLLSLCHPPQCTCLAVGRSTALLLQKAGWQVLTPANESSEGLLSLDATQVGYGRSVLLIKGEGGRDILAPTLQKRGFTVELLDLYRRVPLTPPVVSGPFSEIMCKGVICTSGEAAQALLSWVPEAVTRLPWLTVSQRVANILHEGGIKTVEICEAASDHAIIEWIQRRT